MAASSAAEIVLYIPGSASIFWTPVAGTFVELEPPQDDSIARATRKTREESKARIFLATNYIRIVFERAKSRLRVV